MKIPRYSLSILLSLFCLGFAATQGFSKIEHSTVFESGKEGYHTFRIPSVIKAPNGDLLAFCEGRKNSRSDRGNIDILMKRSSDGGRTWSALQVIWDDGEDTCGNPCAVVDEKTGVVWLLLSHNIGSDREKEIIAGESEGTRTAWVCSSTDNGKTWGKPIDITKTTKDADWRWYATGPGVGVQIQSGPHAGRLVIPGVHSFTSKNPYKGGYYGSHAIYSDDHGKTWQLGAPIQPLVNECQLVELFDGKGTLMMNMRSYAMRGCRSEALSPDGGKTWGPQKDAKALPEPVCQASILRWEVNGKGKPGWLVFSNPASTEKRINMTVRASEDNGATWPRSLVLNTGSSAYSCLIALDANNAGCLYEAGEKSAYEKLLFARFSKEDF